MTLQTVLAWSLIRSILVSSIALPGSILIVRTLRSEATAVKRFSFGLLLVALLPLFVPDLLTGFSYRMTAARLIHSSVATEFVYGGLLLFRVIALQVALQLVLTTSAINPRSLHSWKLLPNRNFSWWQGWLMLQVSGPCRNAVVAFIAGSLFCLQDFETAALMQVDRHPIVFTVWLFDAHAAGETLSRSLTFIAGYAAVQLTLLSPALFLITKIDSRTLMYAPPAKQASGVTEHLATTVILIAGSWALVLWPSLSNGGVIIKGLQTLAEHNSMNERLQQIFLSWLAAAISAALSLLIAASLIRRQRFSRIIALLPGLLGSLVLSLCLLAIIQSPILNFVYDTWLPMVAGSAFSLLPRSFLMAFLLTIGVGATSRYSALLLVQGTPGQSQNGRALLWKVQQQRWLLAWAILAHWSFWDVTIASILRPVRFEPVVTRLYNEMHYGRTESLVAMTFLSLLIPLLVFMSTMLLLRFIFRIRHSVA